MSLLPYSKKPTDPEKTGGTVCALCIDHNGNCAAGVSTSGWAWKYPGRLGDSPLIGSGCYADERYGAAACIGSGEMAIRAGTARSVVLYLKMGLSLPDACGEAAADLAGLKTGRLGGVTICAIDKNGEHCVLAVGESGGKQYFVKNDGMAKCEKKRGIFSNWLRFEKRVSMGQIFFKEVQLPEIKCPEVEPVIGAAAYDARISSLRDLAAKKGIDTVIVYGDREHWANITFLTNYDPRFEETLLILREDEPPRLVVGNEGMSFSQKSPVNLERMLYQEFSLMGQDRSRGAGLADILESAGVHKAARVGVIDWKYFQGSISSYLNAPAYVVDTIRQVSGSEPVNATDLMMNPVDGLRVINDVDQLARFEFVAACVTDSMKRIQFGLREGMSEFEAFTNSAVNGLPYSCHPVLSAGPHAGNIDFPSSYRMKLGDPVIFGITGWGALSARAGFLVHGESELKPEARDYIEELVKPYFRAVASWYETVGIGVSGGDLFDAVHSHIGGEFAGIALNPGHYIHLEEWVHSPVYKGSQIRLRSGMALQADIIPVNNPRYFTSNAEDGIGLADAETRREFSEQWPEGWRRIQARREFVQEVLGINLKPEVLPFSNIQAYLAPFLLNPNRGFNAYIKKVKTDEKTECLVGYLRPAYLHGTERDWKHSSANT